MINEDELPNPRPPLKHPPLMDLSFAALGWVLRCTAAVGSTRFDESIERARFYIDRAGEHAHTPAERAVVQSMADGLDEVCRANARAASLLGESVSGMDAAEATEFVELCEAEPEAD